MVVLLELVPHIGVEYYSNSQNLRNFMGIHLWRAPPQPGYAHGQIGEGCFE